MYKPHYFKCINCYALTSYNYSEINEFIPSEDNKEFKRLTCTNCNTPYAIDNSAVVNSPNEAADLSLSLLKKQIEILSEEKTPLSEELANSIIFDQVKELHHAIKYLEDGKISEAKTVLHEQILYIEKELKKSFSDSICTEHLISEESNGK